MTGKWKIGCTLQRQKESRHTRHVQGNSRCPLFDNYIKKRYSEGKLFDEVFEYFQLRVFVCSRRDAEWWEDIYTARYDALSPNGFNLRSGGYRGAFSQELKHVVSIAMTERMKENNYGVHRMSETKRGRTKENDEGRRRASKKLCGRNKHNHDSMRVLSEKNKGNKSACKENWAVKKRERFERKKREGKKEIF